MGSLIFVAPHIIQFSNNLPDGSQVEILKQLEKHIKKLVKAKTN